MMLKAEQTKNELIATTLPESTPSLRQKWRTRWRTSRAFTTYRLRQTTWSSAPKPIFTALRYPIGLARRFTGVAPKVRIYNPSAEEHGWQSTHTVIEIVNDDMPFLVDSIIMEVNRQALTLHLIIHPVMRIERDGNGEMLKVENARR
jgi:NAD-specific glutamate dehydrogenase